MISIKLNITSHYDHKSEDYAKYITRLTRNKGLEGTTVGGWTATLKLPHGDPLEERLREVVRDDDWVELRIEKDGVESTWTGLIDETSCKTTVDSNGVEIRWWMIRGSDWGRCLAVGQVRLSAVFSSFAQKVVWDTATIGTTIGATASALVNPMSLPTSIAAIVGSIAETIDENERARAAAELAMIPGVIDVPRWDKIIGEAFSWNENAAVPLIHLIIEMLRGQWIDASSSAEPLVFRLNYDRFGPVQGVPYKLNSIVGQQMITCDQLLRQFGNMPWTEIFYDNGPNGRMDIVFRDAPYGSTELTPGGMTWDKLAKDAVEISADNILNYEFTRCGAERYTFWRPIAAGPGMSGYDLLIDTEDGVLPLIDKSDVPAHGIRVAEPHDDYFPPSARLSENMLRYYKRKIATFREWHKNRPEFLTGQVTVKTFDPRVRIGTVVGLPIPWEFRNATTKEIIKATKLYGYVTGVGDDISVEQARGVVVSTTTLTLTTVRPATMPVAALESWAINSSRESGVSSAPLLRRVAIAGSDNDRASLFAYVKEYAKQYGFHASNLLGCGDHETGGTFNLRAQNPDSRACGAFQILPSNIKKYGYNYEDVYGSAQLQAEIGCRMFYEAIAQSGGGEDGAIGSWWVGPSNYKKIMNADWVYHTQWDGDITKTRLQAFIADVKSRATKYVSYDS